MVSFVHFSLLKYVLCQFGRPNTKLMYNPISVMTFLLEAFLQLKFDVFVFKCCIKICTAYVLLQLVSQLHKNTFQM